MKKITVVLCFVVGLATILGSGFSRAAEVGVLIAKLVEKGILSESEAKQLLDEMQKKSTRQKNEIQPMVAEGAKKEDKNAPPTKLSKFLGKTHFKGDLRLRYQGEDYYSSSEGDSVWQNRGRFRWRFGAETEITEQWKAGFGLASGSGDPRSTNQSFGDTFSSKHINIDYAYAGYQPFEWLGSVAGKFKNPLWEPKDLLWDTDIRPEGVSLSFHHKAAPQVGFFFTPGLFVIREFNPSDDIYMLVFQPGVNWAITDTVDLTLTGSYYNFQNLKGNSVEFSSQSNSKINGDYLWDYNSLAGGAELCIKLQSPYVPYLALFGQYVNADTNEEDTGYLAGVRFGQKKLSKLGDWRFVYNYRRLERNAWPDFLPDSDFFGGATNVKGHEVEFNVGIAKNATIGLDWYHTKLINKNDPAFGVEGEDIVEGLMEQDLVQVDLVLTW